MAVAARLYARSLFEAALERDRVETAYEELGDFVAAVRDVPELHALLTNPEIDRDERTAALRDILGDADELVRNFVLLLSDKGRAGQLEEIHRELDDLVAAYQGRLNVELTTAFELSDEEADSIVRKIEEAAHRAVEATRTVDPSLIGGIVLQVGSQRVDASVRGRLEHLRQELVTRS